MLTITDRTVSVLGYVPLLFVMLPLLHWVLLRSDKALSNKTILALTLPSMFTLPLLFPCNIELIQQMGMASCLIAMTLRTMEVATYSREINSSWSFLDYAEFMLTSDNSNLRAIAKAKEEEEKRRREKLNLPPVPPKWKPITYIAEERDFAFYGYFLLRMGITGVVYIFCRGYLEKYGFEHRFGLVAPWDFKAFFDHMCYSMLVYSVLEFGWFGSMFLVASMLGTPLVYMFHYPHLSTSPRDYWSYRWNFAVKELLHRLSFLQTLFVLDSFSGSSKKDPSKRAPASHFAIASLNAFLLSALIHEYLVFLFLEHRYGENTLFFVLQAVFCFTQVQLQQMTGFGKTWGKNVTGMLFGWTTTMLLLFCTSPLFLGPYARAGFLLREMQIPVPNALMEFAKSFI